MTNPYQPPTKMVSSDVSNQVDDATARSRFRKCLIAAVVVSVMGIVVSFATETSLPVAFSAYLENQTLQVSSALEYVINAVFLLVVVLAVWNVFQLYNFRPHARAILISLLIAETLIGLLSGPMVDSPLSSTFADASMLLWGVVIAMMYCTPYADCFSAPSPQVNG